MVLTDPAGNQGTAFFASRTEARLWAIGQGATIDSIVQVNEQNVLGLQIPTIRPVQPPLGPTNRASVGPSTTAALVSSSFTPAPGSLLIAVAYGNSGAVAANSATITDSVGGGWQQIALANWNGPVPQGPSYVQAWWKLAGGNPAARTVTITDANGTMMHGGWVEEWTSTNPVNPIGAVVSGSIRDPIDLLPLRIELPATARGSRIAGGASNWDGCTFGTQAGDQITNQQTSAGAVAGCSFCRLSATPGGGRGPYDGAPQTLLVTRDNFPSTFAHFIAWEVQGKWLV